MGVVKALLKILGWLLTPLVAWAASFVGAWLGAMAGAPLKRPMATLWVTASFGVAAALIGAWAWLRLLRRSRRLREVLAVEPDGTPIAVVEEDVPKETPR